jgi:Cys-tRNA(Pro) deacylase
VADAAHPSQQRVREAAARKGVRIDIVTFDESTHTAQEAADAIGAELAQIVKSLVFVGDGPDGPEAVIALVSGTDRVDIGRLGSAVSRVGLRRATADEASAATGYVIGGIPPIGHRRPIPVVMDPRLMDHAEVWAAAGTPNAVFAIDPRELARLAEATIAPCAQLASPQASRPAPASRREPGASGPPAAP